MPPPAASAARNCDQGDPAASGETTAADSRIVWRDAFRAVRQETERRAAPLAAEDQQIQSMPDASPTKWHRAHSTWFLEEFLLRPQLAGYQVFDARFAYLFNSYYVAAGPRHARPRRGLLTRPDCAEVTRFRAHVDAAIERLLSNVADAHLAEVVRVLKIALHHEQQHQELLLTDILHAFAQNPLAPAYDPSWRPPRAPSAVGKLAQIPSGLNRVGFAGEGYCFDNERPEHQVWLEPARIARRLVTNAQWLEFMADGGYSTPSLWLSDGWAALEAEGWKAPGYWREHEGAWLTFSLRGLEPVDPAAAVMHVSYYEADAFARWAGKHLPSEAEWETATRAGVLDDAFGVVWQWTRSPYTPYPGYRAADGALGEYNGKFMVNQMVLRGSSHATPAGHSRASYRNFFYPPARWQFSGLRLLEYDR